MKHLMKDQLTIKLKSASQNTSAFKIAVVGFLAEFVGTAILLFMGCMGGVSLSYPGSLSDLQIGLIFGLTIATIVQVFGHISGAHFNPAVTCSAWLFGLVSLPLALVYIVAQIVGAIGGFGLLTLVTPEHILNETSPAFCSTIPHAELTTTQAFFAEFLISTVLILLCCACWDQRNGQKQDSTAIKFGLLITLTSIAAGPYTGASMNPARTLAPAILNNAWDDHWIYWVAPLAAGFIVTGIYLLIFNEKEKKDV